MATYHGEVYLAAQLESILQQTYPYWTLYVRDDGSSDGTVRILRHYAGKYPHKIHLVEDGEKALGAAQSFARLLLYSTEYGMFCDQDDIWLPEKIERTLAKMREFEGASPCPLLVHTDLKVVDAHLTLLADSFWNYQHLSPEHDSLTHLLIQNVITGCTVMFNRKLRELALPIPQEAIMHDWWLGLVATALGKVVYLAEPTVLYRQHDNNNLGAVKWDLRAAIGKMRDVKGMRASIGRAILQAKAFSRHFHTSLDEEAARLVSTFARLDSLPLMQRKLAVLRHGYLKSGLLRNVGFFLLV